MPAFRVRARAFAAASASTVLLKVMLLPAAFPPVVVSMLKGPPRVTARTHEAGSGSDGSASLLVTAQPRSGSRRFLR